MQGQRTAFRISRMSDAKRDHRPLTAYDRAEKIVLFRLKIRRYLILSLALRCYCILIVLMYFYTLEALTELNLSILRLGDLVSAVLDLFHGRKKKNPTLLNLSRNGEPCDISGSCSLFMSAALWFYGSCLMLTKAGGTSCLSGPIKPHCFFFFLKAATVSEGSWRPNQFLCFLSALLSVGRQAGHPRWSEIPGAIVYSSRQRTSTVSLDVSGVHAMIKSSGWIGEWLCFNRVIDVGGKWRNWNRIGSH